MLHKSSTLHKSSMLHRSFKPAKCKTAMKMAVSRIKLLKNKKEAQLKQLKRELAQLLEAGQDQTARIRVEHVVREEKTMAAYELIEIYCELIVARLPIIESQKHCPIDLKEAISSLIFASPRCADIPELMDVHKQFTVKYGKEFVSAAVELRPDCGVSRLLVEKLSAKAPDGPTKIKILSTIAEEHNVKWDPKSFGEKDIKPYEDLLNGPNTFEQASKIHVKPPDVQEPANTVHQGPNAQLSSNHYEKHNVPVDSYDPSSISSLHYKNSSSDDTGANKTTTSENFHANEIYQRDEAKGMESRYPNSGDGSGPSLSKPSWNMEFEDASVAAQAAAEAAEHASMAARAAAELSSQGRKTRQESTESQEGFAGGSRDEGLENYAGRKLQGEHSVKDPVTKPFHERKSEVQQEQSNGSEHDELAGLMERFYNLKSSDKPSQPSSLKSSNISVDHCLQVDDVHMASGHSRGSSSELEKNDLFGATGVKTSESEVEVLNEVQDGMKFENVGYFEEAKISKKSSNTSLHSHSYSQTCTNDINVFSNFEFQESREESVEDHFIVSEGKIDGNIKEENSRDNASVVFDDSDSDDEIEFDMVGERDGLEHSSYLSSEGRNLSSQLDNTSAWISRENTDDLKGKYSSESYFSSEQPFPSVSSEGAVFSEALANDNVSSQPDYLLPVTFDDSDGPSSDSEYELEKSKLVGNTIAGVFSHVDSVYSGDTGSTQRGGALLIKSSVGEEGNVGSSQKKLSRRSSGESDVKEVGSERDQEIEARAENERKFDDVESSHSSSKSRLNSNDFSDNLQTKGFSSVKGNVQIHQPLDAVQDTGPIGETSLESGKKLNFQILTGGLKNKGYKHPPYRRNPSQIYSSPKQVTEDDSTGIGHSSSSHKFNMGSRADDQELYNQRVHPKVNKKANSSTTVTHISSSDDGSDEEPPQPTLSSGQEPYSQQPASDVNRKSSSRTYFDSDDGDSEEDTPKQTLTGKIHSNIRFSRRTKVAPSNSVRNSYSKATVMSDSSVNADSVAERKPSLMSYPATESRQKPHSRVMSLDNRGSYEQSKSAKQEAPEQIPQNTSGSHEESSSRISSAASTQQDSLPQFKGSDFQQRSGHTRPAKPVASKQIPESKMFSHKETLNSSAEQEPHNLPPKTIASGGAESANTSSSTGQLPLRESSINKASHVHPKLPDYDSFTAHLLSLRQNRQ